MKRTAVILSASLMLAVTACATDGEPDDRPGEESPTPGGGATEAGSLIGVLGGDAQLEGGCIWIEPTGGPDAELGDRVEPILPAGFTVEFEPDLRILDPEGSVVAERGDEIVIDGRPAEDVVTICQVGPTYAVDAITGTAGR